jgi:hypothetical protein
MCETIKRLTERTLEDVVPAPLSRASLFVENKSQKKIDYIYSYISSSSN